RPESVSIEDGADVTPVAKRQRSWPIPGLDQTGMILVEGALLLAHLGGVLPGLRNEHHHAMRKRAAGEIEELDGIVENGRVTRAFRKDGQQLLYVVAEQLGLEQRLASVHRVHVPAQRVDLAVMAQKAEGLREGPPRKCVRREARVHHG